ncbi:MAG: PAS domain S-box-containing protein [Lentisphaeria bacterium]|jgi:PAS domain S-box-containing protein
MQDIALEKIKIEKKHKKIYPKQADEKFARLSATLNRYDRIFWGANDYGFLDWELASGHVYWQGGFWDHLGYDDDDHIDLFKVDNFIAYVYSEDQAAFSECITQLLKKGQTKDFVFRVRAKDGTYVWAEARVDALRRADGRVTHVSGVIFDLSRQKTIEQALLKSEARHTRIISSSNDGLWEWSAKDGVRLQKSKTTGELEWCGGQSTFSSRCWELLGYDVNDPRLKDHFIAWRNFMHKDDGRRFDKIMRDLIVEKTPCDFECRMRTANGGWCWVRTRGQMIYDDSGQPLQMSGTIMDITELKVAQERVLKAKVEAEKASVAKSDFLSSMSHELRTPLNAILGFARLLEIDTTLNAEHKDKIREITSAGNHLLNLVGDVLDLAKIETKQLKINRESVLPLKIINECEALLASQIEQRCLHFDLQFFGLEASTIYADTVRFKQVLLNLIGNSVKYNRYGGAITVTYSKVKHNHLRIAVSDTGIGIPQHRQQELFQAFNRLGAEHSGLEGSGVGLVITKQLVTQMGGTIGYHSEENVGSQFWVEFPLVSEVEAPRLKKLDAMERIGTMEKLGELEKLAALETSLANKALPELLVKQVKKILYVEDNLSNQKLVRQFLGRYSMIDLTLAEAAVKGLFLARTTEPDLILLDVNLPGLNGFELVAILKQDTSTSHIPVVALSANVLQHDIEAGLKAGFDHYLTKPLSFAALIDVINRWLK